MQIKTCAALDCENQFEAITHNKKYCSTTCKNRMRSLVEKSTDEVWDFVDDVHADTYSNQTSMSYQSYYPVDYADPEFLRKENVRLGSLVNKHRNMADEILTEVHRAIAENVRQITVNPPKNLPRKDYKEELVINPSNSDNQLGKVTPTYNTQICMDRVGLWTDEIIANTEMFRQSYPIRKAHVWFLGDIVEGEGIFPTQPHVIDTSIYAQVAKNGPQMYADQLRRLLEVFEEVEVVCVIGNHGRLSKFHNPESNMDRMLYKILEHIFAQEPRIKFRIPDGHGESMFWAVDAIGNYSTLLIHGDQLPAPTSGITYQRKILGWKAGAIPVPFDDVILGHWHQNSKLTINQTVVRVAGSTESTNTFAQERLAAIGRPSQHLQLINPTKGIFWESDVYLD